MKKFHALYRRAAHHSLLSVHCLPKDPHDPEELSNPSDLRELAGGRGVDQPDADVVRQDGQQVDHVHWRLDELHLARTSQQTDLQNGLCQFMWLHYTDYESK